MEPFEAFDRAVASTAARIEGIGAGQLSAPTPCTEWDVRTLLNHLVGSLYLCEDLFTGRPPRHGLRPGGVPDVDLLGADPAASYAAAAAAALAVAGDGDTLARAHATPLGELPGAVLAGFITLDVFVHGWDLARATGQDSDLDDDLCDHVLAFAEKTLSEEGSRVNGIGPALSVGPGASATDRLVAFLGRQP